MSAATEAIICGVFAGVAYAVAYWLVLAVKGIVKWQRVTYRSYAPLKALKSLTLSQR